jgi:hypothetical protein
MAETQFQNVLKEESHVLQEGDLLKVPLEVLSRVFRNAQKSIEKELIQTVQQVSELEKKKGTLSKEDTTKQLEKLSTKLTGAKRKV